MATFGALRGVRLGHWERALLLYAPPPGSKEAPDATARELGITDVITGMRHVTGRTRSERQAKFRAARRLEDLGLIEYANQRYGPRGVWIELTPLGAEVVDRYHHELESGLRIRWPQEEN